MGYILIFLLTYKALASSEINDTNIEKLVEASPQIQQIQARLESAEQLRGNLKRSFLPKVGLSYGMEQFTTGPYSSAQQPFGGAEVQLNLYNSGRDQIESRLRDTKAQIAKLDVTLLRTHLLSEIKKSLSHYAFLSEIISITRVAIEQNEENLKSATRRMRAGLSSSTDLLDFKQQKVHLQQELASLDFEMGVTKRLINTLLGQHPQEDIIVKYTNSHPDHSKDVSINLSPASSLLTKKFQLITQSSELEYDQSKRWWAPSIDVYGYAMRFTQKEREYTPSSSRNDVTFGFKFNFPIFDGGEAASSARASKALVESKRQELRESQLALERDSLDAARKLSLAHDLIHGAEESVKLMSEYRLGVLNEYSKGIKNSPDVLQASQRWIHAKIRHAEVKKNYQFAKVEAEYLQALQMQ